MNVLKLDAGTKSILVWNTKDNLFLIHNYWLVDDNFWVLGILDVEILRAFCFNE